VSLGARSRYFFAGRQIGRNGILQRKHDKETGKTTEEWWRVPATKKIQFLPACLRRGGVHCGGQRKKANPDIKVPQKENGIEKNRKGATRLTGKAVRIRDWTGPKTRSQKTLDQPGENSSKRPTHKLTGHNEAQRARSTYGTRKSGKRVNKTTPEPHTHKLNRQNREEG